MSDSTPPPLPPRRPKRRKPVLAAMVMGVGWLLVFISPMIWLRGCEGLSESDGHLVLGPEAHAAPAVFMFGGVVFFVGLFALLRRQ